MQNNIDSNRLPDYHLHTVLCKHAKGEAGEYKRSAQNQEIPEICFADHIPNPDGYDPRHRMEMAQFSTYKNIVTELQDGEGPRVLFGFEADYYDGCEKSLREWLSSQVFDLVLGSVHYIEDWGFDNPDQRNVWDSVDVKATWRKYFKLVERLTDSELFDVVAHIDLPKKFGHRPSDNDLKEMAKPVLDGIARAGMGIELNTSGLRKPVGEIYPSPLIVSLAHEREIPICFSSDAHRPEDVGADFSSALKLAREAGYRQYFRISRRKMNFAPLPEL